MDDSILTSIKKLLGIAEDDTSFDQDIIMHINSVFGILRQIGAGPINGFSISDDGETWRDYLEDQTDLEFIKTYIYLKVRSVFDPPTAGSAAESMRNMINELEWRISVTVDPRDTFGGS